MIRHAIALLLLAAPVSAQALPPGRRIATTEGGFAQLDSMARRALITRQEQMACVTVSIMDADTLVIAKVAPAKNVIHADSITMAIAGQPAEWWQPCIHTHFLDWPGRDHASDDDQHSVAVRGVFGLLMIVKPDSTWTLKGYP